MRPPIPTATREPRSPVGVGRAVSSWRLPRCQPCHGVVVRGRPRNAEKDRPCGLAVSSADCGRARRCDRPRGSRRCARECCAADEISQTFGRVHFVVFRPLPAFAKGPPQRPRNAGRVSRPFHLVLSDGFRSRCWLHASARFSRNVNDDICVWTARFWTASPYCRLPNSVDWIDGRDCASTGYLLVTGLVAFVVYERTGLGLLRKAWLNLDLVWALALMVTAVLTLLIPA